MSSSDAFERDLTALLPRLRRFAHALSGNAADADDLTQGAVERALRSRGQWQAGTRLDSWVYRIMRNLWIDTARARLRKERHEAPEEEAQFAGEDPRDAMDLALQLKRAMAAMEQLPDEQREIVALILVEGFGYREVADMLDLPIGTVSSRLARGRMSLMAMLGGFADD